MELIYLSLLLLVVAVAIALTHPAMRDRLFPQSKPVRAYSPRREARMVSSDSHYVEVIPFSAANIEGRKVSADKIRAAKVKAPEVRVDDPTPLFTQMLQSYRDQGIDIS